MSNFNQYFVNTGAKILVDRFLKDVDAYNPDAKMTSLNYSIVQEPPHPASYYIENEITATHKVRLEYTINDDDEIKISEFEVPKEIDGAFIIEGAYRISTNKLGSDYDCRIKDSGTGERIINFDFDRRYDLIKDVLIIKKINPDLGISDRSLEIPYDKIDTLTGVEKEVLKLSEYQTKKFRVKLDLDYTPTYITTRLINDCKSFGDDRLKDLIIDKKIESVSSGFMQYIFRGNNGRNFFTAKGRIRNYWTKYGKLMDQINYISNLAFKYFKGDKDYKASEIQVPPGVNPMNLEALSSKITIPESVAYNTSFTDLIDIADTPINNNTNKQNSLTVSTHITDTDVLFDVYSPDWKVITIPYIDYLDKKVCSSEYVDYNKLVLKPNENGEVECKYRMRRKMFPVDQVELIDLHPDYRLSSTTRRIPFINFTDSVRISMGTSMLKQSIPLVNAERALVDTGRNEELKDNILNEKFAYPEGKVKSITEDKITIELPDKTDIDMPRRTAIQSVNDVSVYFEPKVRVGQRVKKGDIISGSVGLNNETYKAGLNTLVLFHAYHGLVNEDALVVSESYANRMVSYSIIDLMINVKNSAAIKWIAPIGMKVKSKDSVITLYKAVRLNEVNRALNEKLGGIFDGDLSEFTVEDSLKVPNNIDEAVVSDVMIQEMLKPKIPGSVKAPDYTFARSSSKVIEEYENTKDRKVIYDKYPEYIASDILDPIVMNPDEYKVVYTIRVRLIKRQGVIVGSKITSRYGGKGVVSKVVPDELMPLMVDKTTGKKERVEVVMNPYSTINRKIAGVNLEVNLGNIAHKIHDLIDEYKKTKTGQKKIMPMLSKYYPGRYDNMDVSDFIDLHNSKPIEEVYYFNVGCFSEFKPDMVDEWMDDLGLESQSEILLPETDITDFEELELELGHEETEKIRSQMVGKFVPVKKKLQCGYMTLEELYHIPSYSNKVTSSLYGIDINPKKDNPIMGRGKYRETGQVIGEMELSVLLSRNASKFIESSRKDTAQEDNQMFLNNLLGLGLTVTDSKGYNQGGSSLKDKLEKMKAKFRIKKQ